MISEKSDNFRAFRVEADWIQKNPKIYILEEERKKKEAENPQDMHQNEAVTQVETERKQNKSTRN